MADFTNGAALPTKYLRFDTLAAIGEALYEAAQCTSVFAFTDIYTGSLGQTRYFYGVSPPEDVVESLARLTDALLQCDLKQYFPLPEDPLWIVADCGLDDKSKLDCCECA